MDKKLSFALPKSKPKTTTPNPQNQSQQTVQYVTVFDPSNSANPKNNNNNNKNPVVIPPIANEWQPHKKPKKPLFVPTNDDVSQPTTFVPDPGSNPEPDSGFGYGLNLRDTNGKLGNDDGGNLDNDANPSSIEDLMVRKLKRDLGRLQDDVGMEEYEEVAVEDFPKALLAGYGWYEGRGIGRNAKGDVQVKQYERRDGKSGLGFREDPSLGAAAGGGGSNGAKDGKKVDKGRGESNGNGKDVEKRRGENNGFGKGVSGGKDVARGSKRALDSEESTESRGQGYGNERFVVGKDFRIVKGSKAGLVGRVVEVGRGGDSVVLNVRSIREEVRVRARDVADLGSEEEERCLRELEKLKIKEEKEREAVRDGGWRSKESSSEDGKRKDRERVVVRDESWGSGSVCWLNSHIRVRVISKELKSGRLYLQKGEVVDVVGPTVCDISMDGSREIIQGVGQELLETALPKRGGPVLVLFGEHKGVYGSLVEKDLDSETAVVRDADTHEMLSVRLEQIAEYVGDPSHIGY